MPSLAYIHHPAGKEPDAACLSEAIFIRMPILLNLHKEPCSKEPDEDRTSDAIYLDAWPNLHIESTLRTAPKLLISPSHL